MSFLSLTNDEKIQHQIEIKFEMKKTNRIKRLEMKFEIKKINQFNQQQCRFHL